MSLTQRLIGIPEKPEGPGAEDQAGDTDVVAVQMNVRIVLLRVIECGSALEVRTSTGKFSEPKKVVAQDIVRNQEGARILSLRCHGKQPFAECPRRPILGSQFMILPQAAQDRNEISGFAHPLAKIESPHVSLAHLRRGEAANRA